MLTSKYAVLQIPIPSLCWEGSVLQSLSRKRQASVVLLTFGSFLVCVCVYVQTDSVAGQVASVDDSSATNLWKLVATAKQVLDQPVSERNFQTGKLASISNGGNNRDALFRYINSPKPVPVHANFMLSCVCSFQQLNKLLCSVELLK